MTAYYNEIDEYAAQWLRNLIAAGHIAPGVVDTRSIEDVNPEDLRGFTQCHFFAGVGVWSLALRRAGWLDDRAVWTGSCPCQPFSAAGQGAGFSDERHLWPAFHWLIQECRPAVVLGEQVASSDSGPWIDLVHTDMEALGYAFGAVPFPSAGVGAPHIRDRLYWVADCHGLRRPGIQRESAAGLGCRNDGQRAFAGLGSSGKAGRLEHSDHGGDRSQEPTTDHRQPQADRSADQLSRSGVSSGWVGHADDNGARRHSGTVPGAIRGQDGKHLPINAVSPGQSVAARPGPTNGLWAAADWLACRDGRWRPVEPGTFPLVDGAASRVGRLRAYGNAINAEAARVFIEAVMGCQS